MTPISNWRDLPFREIWIVDTEFYPGSGLANGGVAGDPVTPLCLVALEMRSGRLVRLWQDQLGPFPPYRLDNDALIVGYMLAAEFGVHAALGWGEPACALDAYVEFRHYVNDGAVKGGDREKGFYSIGGALRYFLEDEIDVTRKHDMRERILQGPPFGAQEQRDILDYCEDDVRALARLVPHIVPTIRPPLSHALFRAKFQWAIAQQERRGIPLDGALLARLRDQWQNIRLDLVTELDRPFGCYEVVDGVAHWRRHLFADYVRRQRNELDHPRGRHPRRKGRNLSRNGREVSADRAAARAALLALEAAAQRPCSRTRPSQPGVAVGLWHQDRAQCTRRIAVRVRAGQVVAVPDHPATGSRSGAPGLPPAGSSHRRRVVRRQRATASMRER